MRPLTLPQLMNSVALAALTQRSRRYEFNYARGFLYWTERNGDLHVLRVRDAA